MLLFLLHGAAVAKTRAPSPAPLVLSLRKVVSTPVFTPGHNRHVCMFGKIGRVKQQWWLIYTRMKQSIMHSKKIKLSNLFLKVDGDIYNIMCS